MKILKKIITVLVCLILFTSCTKSIDSRIEKEYIEERKEITYYKGEPFTGEIFRNYRNGQLEKKENYKDGKRYGLYETYYKNGQLKTKMKLKNEYLFFSEDYYENGQLKEKINFNKEGNPLSTEYYYEDGSERK